MTKSVFIYEGRNEVSFWSPDRPRASDRQNPWILAPQYGGRSFYFVTDSRSAPSWLQYYPSQEGGILMSTFEILMTVFTVMSLLIAVSQGNK